MEPTNQEKDAPNYPPEPIQPDLYITCPVCGYITRWHEFQPCDLCGDDDDAIPFDLNREHDPKVIEKLEHEQEEARQWIADLNHMGDYVQAKNGYWYRKDPKWISLSDFLQQRSGGQKKAR